MNKVALITGASRGIGAAIAEKLASENFDLTITGRSQETLDEVAGQLQKQFGVNVLAIPSDSANEASLIELATKHSAHYSRLDALVLNAGMGQKGPIAELPATRFDKLFQVNVRSNYTLIQELIPVLRTTAEAEGKAKVIGISSITGVYPEAELAAYGATKAGLISLLETFNLEESKNGITATSLAPGYVDTDMASWTRDMISQADLIQANDIAELVLSVTRLSRNAIVPNMVVTRGGENLCRA